MKFLIFRPERFAIPSPGHESSASRHLITIRLAVLCVTASIIAVMVVFVARATVRNIFGRLNHAIHEQYIRGAHIPVGNASDRI